MKDLSKKLCVSCTKRPAITKVGTRHLCEQCKVARDKAVKAAKK